MGRQAKYRMEDVIKGLKCCRNIHIGAMLDDGCNQCPYQKEKGQTCNADELFHDAIAMLKAQEPDKDWISKKRLQDEIQYYIDEAGWGDEVNKVLGWCLEFIDNQRTVKWE